MYDFGTSPLRRTRGGRSTGPAQRRKGDRSSDVGVAAGAHQGPTGVLSRQPEAGARLPTIGDAFNEGIRQVI